MSVSPGKIWTQRNAKEIEKLGKALFAKFANNHETNKDLTTGHSREREISRLIAIAPIILYRAYTNTETEYIHEATQKTHIVWHGTQGRTACTPYKGKPGDATSSIDTWNDDSQRVGAPFLIDRDGTIYQTFMR